MSGTKINLKSASWWMPLLGALCRYMKIMVLLLFLVALLGLRFALGQEQQTSLQSAAPTGTYSPYVNASKDSWSELTSFPTMPPFTLHLETNGTYFAKTTYGIPTQDGDLLRLLPETARGTWRWDKEKRQFSLEPGNFTFYIKCLPVDKQYTNRLVWGISWLVREEDK